MIEEPDDGTARLAGTVERGAGKERILAGFGGLLAIAAAAWLLTAGGRTGLTGGILVAVAALALTGVALGGGRWGPAVEGRLDLSARLGLGLLGGTLGGIGYTALQWASGLTGVMDPLGVRLPWHLPAIAWSSRAMWGALLGLVFGIAYPLLPGRSAPRRGAVAGLLLALFMLLYWYPVEEGFGLLALRLGTLTPVLILVFAVVAGSIAGATVGWGARTPDGAVSRPLGEPE